MQRRSAYPTKEFEKDFRRLRMAESLRQARLLREETNRAAAYLMTAREGELRAALKSTKIPCGRLCMPELRRAGVRRPTV